MPRLVWVTVGFVVVSVAFWGWLQSRRGDYRALDTQLVQPRAADDRLIATMMPVLQNEVGRAGGLLDDPAVVEAWLCTHRALLDRLAVEGWWTMERPSFAHLEEIGDRSRWHGAKTLASFTSFSFDDIDKLKRLVLLRAYEADRMMVCGATREGILGFHDAVGMAGLFCQNPSLVELMSGSAVWTVLAELLDRAVPPELAAEFAVRFPSQAELRWAYLQAMYMEGLMTRSMFQNPESMGAGRLWLVDEERTLLLLSQRMNEMHDYLSGPYDRPSPAAEPLGDWSDYIHNLGGKIMVDVGNMDMGNFTDKMGLLIALMDRMRVRLLLRSEGVAGDGGAVATLVARLGLRDPFDGKLYRVDEKGRFGIPGDALRHLYSARLSAYFVAR